MKKIYKPLGILLIVLGIISMLLLLAKGIFSCEIDHHYLLGLLVFMAVAFPSFGIQLIRKNKT
ncbi:hypothetical protein L3049_18500 [Labilibaculum sp. DW002]|uniref:Uncharacterized protein n=1 Tax=Paralabilibaculum antarcticum TaxID=2912572 RepID=A0ABT5W078_9BACT|nr:hypothetical protein [Labilibaculum sp. DW002]MDE5419984.1 hypothetical protein [Labilibaculum sp. DW002]